MKLVSSEHEFVFPYDGSTKVEITKKGTEVSDEIAEVILERFPFVNVEEVDKKTTKKTTKKTKKEDK